MKEIMQRSWPHILAILIFLVLGFAYMYPVLEGKALNQYDVKNSKGMQGEINEYHEETGDYTLWTNSMFGGMPTYQINMSHAPNHNIFLVVARVFSKILPKYSVDVWFLYCIGFYILLMVMGVNHWLAIVGSIAFALSSYNLIYLEAGHVNRAFAIAMMAPTFAGVELLFRKKYFTGFLVLTFFLGLQLAYNHVQMTYYLFLMVLVYGIYQLIRTYYTGEWKHLLVATGIGVLAALLAIGPNLTNLLTTWEYGKKSMRGGSELAVHTSDSKTSEEGLEETYAMAWSNGVAETFTLMIPNFHGGASVGELPGNSALFDALRRNNVPAARAKQIAQQNYTYWGNKTVTSGPFYFGAIICFLFILGFFVVDNKIKWWILAISILAILWSWGENFPAWNRFFFNNFPLFNKFRVPETFLVITSLTFPLLAIMAVRSILQTETFTKDLKKVMLNTLYVIGGLLVFFYLFAGTLFDFSSLTDAQLENMPPWYIDALREDRMQLLKNDALRSLIFILLTFGAIWLFLSKKLKTTHFIIAIGVLILFDLWGVDRRYLNEDDFASKREATEIQPTQADLQIMQDPDISYRVFNLTQSPFQESHTSYFHHSLGGYHGAKMARYQDIIETHLAQQNMEVINMLNTKYLIVPGENNQPVPQQNPGALGNAWFVDNIKIVNNPQEEIDALNEIDPAQTAVYDQSFEKFSSYMEEVTLPDSVAKNSSIRLTEYKPDELMYTAVTPTGGFAVFSEIYYNGKNGWKAYLNGERVEHIRVNYILRGMYIPAGEHEIRFEFEPEIFYTGQRASMVASIILSLLLLAGFVMNIRKTVTKKETE
ncbi:MAG: hypothetical protein ACOC0C_03280 [Bacteroidota bacterium]